ncbi:uncharacterized protein GGS22DRAFT_183463 [Annulohypoxylon maeteangense]|uniref:uncharacterized protein n=1 Tax=Annulohypoxylon maeteangense TaxID=1927788 RepID=UPI002008727B|nr:uncharacterized protein GGS22DRAFT_183463 [Annulohypoxylon maeteangense]KAI0890116.1 hypothetical protein GGS22DRAFT_183463 [Annulohypoxylon maeteangense]
MEEIDPNIDLVTGEECIEGLDEPDVRARCGHFVYPVHTAVLRPGSRFLQLALRDDNGVYHLNLDNEDSDLVRWLFIYLYQDATTRGLQQRLDDPESFFDTCHEILHIAAAYSLWRVQHLLLVPLRDLFTEQSSILLNYANAVNGQLPADENEILEDNFGVEFVQLASRIYSHTRFRPLRPAIVSFIVASNCVALEFNVFLNVVRERPVLFRDILVAIVERLNSIINP